MIMGSEHFVTCGQMKILERRADENGLSYYQMMENAGRRASEIIEEKTVRALSTKSSETSSLALVLEPVEVLAAALKWRKAPIDSTGKKDIPHFISAVRATMAETAWVSARILRKAGWRITVILVDGKPPY